VTPPAPTLLPGYSDLTEIGGGAFATVYSASEEATGRSVALKILKIDTVHEHLIETFQQEIEALAKVSDHPNIVTLYRPLITPDGRPVLVLELCRESMGERVRTAGPLDAVEVVRVGIKIAGALETAHRNGFLHRDMKPQNILITQFGEPALADFGVAALQASAQATAGVFGFTTLHAAPEVLEGQSLSPATDIYGLASTMYQLLTGAAPFAAFENEAPASVILRILRDPVRPLRSESVPLDLSDLLEAALAKDPSFRPSTAVEFANSLQSVEVAAGWPQTTYVAWGEVTGTTASDSSKSHPPDQPASARTLPPLLPAPPHEPVSEAPAPPPVVHPPVPMVPRSPLDVVTEPPEPGVQAPEGATRNIVAPTEYGRGQPARPIEPAPALSPLVPPSGVSESEGPEFVDPEPPLEVPPELAGPSNGRDGSPRNRLAAVIGEANPLAVAALILAFLVIVVAILLIAGVL
jgi:serine/threonine protein kinase